MVIEIRFTINFIISNFYRMLSYLCPRWILYAIFFIYYDFTDILARCTIVHCFYHVCMNVCDSWVFKDSFVSIKILSIYIEAQYGFRKGRSTTDCIFVLNSIINEFAAKKKTLYAILLIIQRHLIIL